MGNTKSQLIPAEDVLNVTSMHMLTSGMMPIVLDMERSHGVFLYDQRDHKRYIDFFGFYASSALGMNHPKQVNDRSFMRRLAVAAVNKITNSDVLTQHKARFLNTFSRVGIPDYLPYAFLVSGGALAVENALKTAFDWKVRKNFAKGYRREVGTQVLHFEQAFHGRSGYTLSLTNTSDPRKTMHFPKFDWPRVVNPKMSFPVNEKSLAELEKLEALALAQARKHFEERGDDIACILIEPIQGEGGDNHFRPEFLTRLKELTVEFDALLVFDEVQTGVGITGSFWAHQGLGVEPDILAFGKKTQVCGILAGRRLDEVDGHVFQTPSRINSTWGGSLVDMIRFDRILEIIEEDELVEHTATVGAYLLGQLHALAEKLEVVGNVRGRGLMCAFDLPGKDFRDRVLKKAFDNGLIILGCGTNSVRFRSPLTITEEELDEGLDVLCEAIRQVSEHSLS